MVDRFDLEQAIMACWNVTDDIDVIYGYVMDPPGEKFDTDQVANMLLGIQQLYELKFRKMFDMFETMTGQGLISNQSTK